MNDGGWNETPMQVKEKINELLFFEWDPLGISELDGFGETNTDEYRRYVEPLYDLLRVGSDSFIIMNYLNSVEYKLLGRFLTYSKSLIVSQKLSALSAEI